MTTPRNELVRVIGSFRESDATEMIDLLDRTDARDIILAREYFREIVGRERVKLSRGESGGTKFGIGEGGQSFASKGLIEDATDTWIASGS